jgi:NADH/NAD ratio-sensing transcriptional regulator Rex
MGSMPPAVIARLCEYRRQLPGWIAEGNDRIFSRELAELIAASPSRPSMRPWDQHPPTP